MSKKEVMRHIHKVCLLVCLAGITACDMMPHHNHSHEHNHDHDNSHSHDHTCEHENASQEQANSAQLLSDSKNSDSAFVSHGKHVHGEANISLIAEKKRVVVNLTAPSIDIVGFEKYTNSAEQQKALELASQILGNYDTVLDLNNKKCNQESQSLQYAFEDPEATHTDITAEYGFYCADTQNLKTIDINLFSRFKTLQKINVEWVINNKQGYTVLTPDNAQIVLQD